MTPPTLDDHLLFIDESGDHVLDKVDREYPLFVLVGVLVRKDEYARQLVPSLVELKLKHFGSDASVLHEREIRKALPPFAFLRDQARRSAFLADVSAVIASAPATVVAAAIKKEELKRSYSWPASPYDLALSFVLERMHLELTKSRGLTGGRTRAIVEARGAKEDADLELEFRRICDGGNYCREQLQFDIEFVRKENNVAGLQLADLMARPIGRHVLNPGQPNAAFDVVKTKLRRQAGRVSPIGYGLKVFP